ncbi:MAG: hypothetical protein WC297_01805 [Candidatus Paceibacterota bacterium]|jgi:hypothetical protein
MNTKPQSKSYDGQVKLPRRLAGNLNILCSRCGQKAIKSGIRKIRQGTTQKYYCNHCQTYFSISPLPYRRYSPTVILNAITTYNLGHTLQETKQEIARRFKIKVPQSTIHSWLIQFTPICTFINYRKKFSLDKNDLIVSRVFSHQQEYQFKFHRLKVNILCKKYFPEIRRYLWWIRAHCPKRIFVDSERCSKNNLHNIHLTVMSERNNNAVALAKLGLMLAKRNTERHQAIQNFMLINDTATIALELPIYLYPNEAPDLNLTKPLTGHIDILQVRYDHLCILDYKPDARYETRAKYQTYLYARALSKRTGIPLAYIRWAYFDDKNYYEVRLDL